MIDKTPQMACSLCGNGMHLGCGVRNITISLPRRIEWFRRTFRLNLVSYNGRYVHTFPLAATTS